MHHLFESASDTVTIVSGLRSTCSIEALLSEQRTEA